jgi:hypothetical protein
MGKTFSRPRSNIIEYRPPPPPEDLDEKCKTDIKNTESTMRGWYDRLERAARYYKDTRSTQNSTNNANIKTRTTTNLNSGYDRKDTALKQQTIRNVFNSFTEGTYDARTLNQYINVYTENLNLKKKIDSLNDKNTQNMQNINFTLVNYTLLQKMNYYSFIFYYIMVLFFIWVLWMNKPFSLLPAIFIIILFLFLPFLLDYIEQYLFLLYKYILYMLVLDRRESTIIHNYVPDNLEYVYNTPPPP